MMPTATVEIRPIVEAEIALLETCFPEGGSAKHAERLSHQQRGEVVYLVAWHQGKPVGHVLLKWSGSQDQQVVRQLKAACPDVEDLFVLAGLRSQGIGRQLLEAAEQLVSQQGFTMIGLSVGAETNDPARRLYERLGYQDAHFGEYAETGEYLDEKGQHHVWKEVCIYLIKGLQDHRFTEAKAA